MKRKFLKQILATAAGLVPAMQAVPGLAQPATAWPGRPIRLIVPFPAGGATDSLARAIGESMATELGQSMIIDNRPGAGGIIGAEAAARAAGDGYTLLVGTNSTLVTGQYLYQKLPYDPSQFELIGLIGITPLILLANSTVPAKTLHELVVHAKENPGKLSYGSFGNGTTSHLAGELFKQMTGTEMLHVPYKGAFEGIPAILSGQIPLYFDTIVTGLPHVKSGKLHALGITTAHRSPMIPATPTIAEQGYPGYDIYPWYGLVAPKGIPREVVEKLWRTLNRSLHDKQLVAKIEMTGAEVTAASPVQFAQMVHQDALKTEKLIRLAGIGLR
ncbi:Bug family tripartite tricarboxylate transporter substrate binding protein [Verminephrobacter eiseniae]|uniref:Bug family tripartite tricarboxylate transporter substrate binding protein n=1 Tax=Verminephrobacter eiseniae TaxID=364317 RepID=UPI002237B7C6|nr:tripartite tricarboxylate transporter substrate binding protein [Verminephrobacter eiseniae]MCW5236451.1 tripartite tricarboxylate transporter substrate binding protein [Verminephrobacter eiseniae]